MFVDVVRYSLLSHEEQQQVGSKLSGIVAKTLLGQQLQNPANGVFLSSGDGFALGFLDRLVHERPNYILELADDIQKRMKPHQLRIGLHCGDALPYSDFNAQFYANSGIENNIAGPGINISQRVMNLGDAGQILASADFVNLYRGAAPTEAAELFHYLGRIRVKHGLALDIYKCGDADPPTRIRYATHAETSVKSLLRHICDKTSTVAHPSCQGTLRPRASILAYDPVSQSLYVTPYRVGADIGDPPAESKIKFPLTEGPGRTFLQARDGRAQVHHVELLDEAVVGRKAYIKELHEKTGISETTIAKFRRRARLYVYVPILHGTDRGNVLGVLSIDTEASLFNRDDMRRQIERRKGMTPSAVELQLEKRAVKYRDRLKDELRDLLRQLSEAWSLLINY